MAWSGENPARPARAPSQASEPGARPKRLRRNPFWRARSVPAQIARRGLFRGKAAIYCLRIEDAHAGATSTFFAAEVAPRICEIGTKPRSRLSACLAVPKGGRPASIQGLARDIGNPIKAAAQIAALAQPLLIRPVSSLTARSLRPQVNIERILGAQRLILLRDLDRQSPAPAPSLTKVASWSYWQVTRPDG